MILETNDKKIIKNIDFAAINSIDGRLTIGAPYCQENIFSIISILSEKKSTENLKYMTNQGDILDVFSGYTCLSLYSVNKDANNVLFWLRKE